MDLHESRKLPVEPLAGAQPYGRYLLVAIDGSGEGVADGEASAFYEYRGVQFQWTHLPYTTPPSYGFSNEPVVPGHEQPFELAINFFVGTLKARRHKAEGETKEQFSDYRSFWGPRAVGIAQMCGMINEVMDAE